MSVQTGHEVYCWVGSSRENVEAKRLVSPNAVGLHDTPYFTRSGPVMSVSRNRGVLVSAEDKSVPHLSNY